jgi:iron(III) transport system substrate-binding protein
MKRIGLFAAATALVAVITSADAQDGLLNTNRHIDTSNGLRINGELIADADLLAKAKAQASIMLYTGVSEVIEQRYAAQFRADTGIRVEVLRLVPSRLAERILSEHGAARLGADVIRTSEADLVNGMAEAGVFAPYRVPFEETLYADAKASPKGLFYLWSSPAYSIGYNTAVIPESQAPKSWKDLLDPKYRGKLGIVQSNAGGSTAALSRFMFDQLGESWLKAYAAQKPRIFDSSARLVDAIARGELVAGPMPPSRVDAVALTGAPLTFILPEEGMVVWPFYMGLSKSAKKVEAAKLYINWVMSKYGQELVVTLGDYAVRPDVGAPKLLGKQLPPFDKVYKVSVDELANHQAKDQKTWNAIFGYTPR